MPRQYGRADQIAISMNNTVSTSTLSVSLCDSTDRSYDYYLAISSDTLVVVNKQIEQVECIIKGTDQQGLLSSCPDEDSFLEALHMVKHTILSGLNPIVVFNLSQITSRC
jgi:hypothetical protein